MPSFDFKNRKKNIAWYTEKTQEIVYIFKSNYCFFDDMLALNNQEYSKFTAEIFTKENFFQ